MNGPSIFQLKILSNDFKMKQIGSQQVYFQLTVNCGSTVMDFDHYYQSKLIPPFSTDTGLQFPAFSLFVKGTSGAPFEIELNAVEYDSAGGVVANNLLGGLI